MCRGMKTGSNEPGELKYPHGLVTDADGNWLVCDYSNHRVQVFSPAGAFITTFGERQGGLGLISFVCPRCVCVDHEGRILVGDCSPRVQVFGFYSR